MTAAQKIANGREGRVAFALIDADGKLHERGGREHASAPRAC